MFQQKKSKVETRRTSSMPKSNEQGYLKGLCFCGKKRRKKLQKEDPLVPANSSGGFERLEERAKYTTNERVKSLIRCGINIISKEADYNKACRIDLNNETIKI